MYFMQKGITIFRYKNFVSDCRKISSRNLSVFHKISGIEKMLGIRKEAGITIFRQNCFVSQYRKTS